MKKSIMLSVLFIASLLLCNASALSEERYIIELDENYSIESIKTKIVEEINPPKAYRQKAVASIAFGKKKLVVANISKEYLEKQEGIYNIETDYKFHKLEDVPWNIRIIGINFSINKELGKGVRIAVFDSGANFALLNVYSGYDFVNEDTDASDDNGHGTFVTQILKSPGINWPLSGAEIYAVKVLNNIGEGYVSDTIEAINWAIDNNIDIVLMSFGGDSDSFFLKDALERAYSAGTLLIAAAGNRGEEKITYPALYDSVIAVGSVNSNLERSNFSNYGNALEFVAPGEDIILTDGIDNYLVAGTSLSVPHVGIVAASYLSDDLSLSTQELREKLQSSALDLGIKGKDKEFGYGLVKYKSVMDAIPVLTISSPSNNSIINASNILVKFNATNWEIGGKGEKHIHFHLSGLPDLSFSDHLMFYNGIDRIVELNLGNGGTGFATWISNNVVRLNNLPNGKYKLRAHLANNDHSVVENPEADTLIMFNVNVSQPLERLCNISTPTNNTIYKENRIKFLINAPKKLDKIEYIDFSERIPRFRILCRDCTEYKKAVSFTDGEHNIIVKCNDEESKSEDYPISLSVDSKEPNILSIRPGRNSFTNGEFTVKYNEDNLKYARLFWNPNLTMNNCPSGRQQECKIKVNLSSWNGQQIEYWFEIEDIAGNKDISNKAPVFIDTIHPIINQFDYSIDGFRVKFIIGIIESNLGAVEYIDYNDRIPRWKALCFSLRNNACNTTKNFRRGNHQLEIKVIDKAGNFVIKNIEFQI